MGTLEASWSVEIAAPRERCYAIAADVEGAPRWQGTLERVEVIIAARFVPLIGEHGAIGSS